MIGRRPLAAGMLALAAAPFGARAQVPQQRSLPRLAVIHPSLSVEELVDGGPNANWSAFFQELRRIGYVEGSNLIVERYSGRASADPYAKPAREAVESRPDVIVATSSPVAIALKALTSTIPIVVNVNDPVASGLVASLARPGANISGFASDGEPALNGKVVQLLKNTVPSATRLAYVDARSMWGLPGAEAARESATALGLTFVPVLLDNPITERSYQDAFATIARERIDAVYLGNSVESINFGRTIARLAMSARLPTAQFELSFARGGGLISYGPDLRINFRGVAGYVDRVLKGARPADLPVQLPRDFEFIINLQTARAIGLEPPGNVLALATEVIE
jgi:putative tryptophan/tyrosine transport system substrate-binding protein